MKTGPVLVQGSYSSPRIAPALNKCINSSGPPRGLSESQALWERELRTSAGPASIFGGSSAASARAKMEQYGLVTNSHDLPLGGAQRCRYSHAYRPHHPSEGVGGGFCLFCLLYYIGRHTCFLCEGTSLNYLRQSFNFCYSIIGTYFLRGKSSHLFPAMVPNRGGWSWPSAWRSPCGSRATAAWSVRRSVL